MGNESCTRVVQCNRAQFSRFLYEEIEPATQRSEIAPAIVPPILDPAIQVPLSQSMLYRLYRQTEQENSIARFGSQIYQGKLTLEGLPHGLGKMYKSDGSFFLGYFNHGKALGNGLYILQDGSYFEGELVDNVADCLNGIYHCQEYTYQGSFKNNQFHGEGKEKGNNYVFKGVYRDGIRQQGELKWWNQPGQEHLYSYIGKFDQNGKFQGQAILGEPTGKYKGAFFNGKKHGKGVYTFKNNTKYQGEYVNGIKEGYGKIVTISDNQLIYQGNWKNNIPDGQGYRLDDFGLKEKTYYVDGINVFSIKDQSAIRA